MPTIEAATSDILNELIISVFNSESVEGIRVKTQHLISKLPVGQQIALFSEPASQSNPILSETLLAILHNHTELPEKFFEQQLIAAIASKNIARAQLIVTQVTKLDLKYSGDDGLTPLHHAANIGNTAIATQLIKRNPACYQPQVLLAAVQNNRLDTAKHLLTINAQPKFVNAENDASQSAAAIAAANGNLEMLTLLHSYRANFANTTVLRAAINSGSHDTVEFALTHMLVDAKTQNPDVTDADLNSYLLPELQQAIALNREDLVNLFITHQATLINFHDTKTPYSRHQHNLPGASISNRTDNDTFTPLMCAAHSNNGAIVTLLLQHGATVDIWRSGTACHTELESKKISARNSARLKRYCGPWPPPPSVDDTPIRGESALSYAVANDNPAMLQQLLTALQQQADTTISNDAGETSERDAPDFQYEYINLFIIAYQTEAGTEVRQLLLQHSPVNVKDQLFRPTVLQLLQQRNRMNELSTLIQHGYQLPHTLTAKSYTPSYNCLGHFDGYREKTKSLPLWPFVLYHHQWKQADVQALLKAAPEQLVHISSAVTIIAWDKTAWNERLRARSRPLALPPHRRIAAIKDLYDHGLDINQTVVDDKKKNDQAPVTALILAVQQSQAGIVCAILNRIEFAPEAHNQLTRAQEQAKTITGYQARKIQNALQAYRRSVRCDSSSQTTDDPYNNKATMHLRVWRPQTQHSVTASLIDAEAQTVRLNC